MKGPAAQKSSTVDALDRSIVHCLQISPRAPFAVVAELLAVSEQTVARRFRRMQAEGLVRVVGLVNPVRLGQMNWSVRVRCRPEATLEIARALARRDDTGWVGIVGGGSEVACVLRSRSVRDRERLMLDQLPRTSAVLSIETTATLHVFRGSTTHDWRIGAATLSGEGLELLSASRLEVDGHTEELAEPDEALLDALAADGRATYAELARATGWNEARAARRLTQLATAGVVYFDVDFALPAFGFPVNAYLSLAVAPARLTDVGTALAGHERVTFVAATTGRTSLALSVVCRTAEELYRFVADDVGALEGVTQVEMALVDQTVKQAGSILDGDRLALPNVKHRGR